MVWVSIVLGCSPSVDTATPPGPTTVAWSGDLPARDLVWSETRGLLPGRAIVHLHSPWSHDACDGQGYDEQTGALDLDCLASLREGLCRTAVDVAYVSDHPSFASTPDDRDSLLMVQPGDERIEVDGDTVGVRFGCEDGHEVLWLPGYEDTLMPLALDRPVADTHLERDAVLRQDDAAAIDAMEQAGATVLLAHTEGRDQTELERLQDDGLVGLEVFNLHAMFAPDIREEDLGLDPFGWLAEIAPFTSPDETGEPDLLFLGVLQDQPPSLDAWDALLARGPMVGVAGTDAHQNVLPVALRDGERGDSYRRMFRWFSNILLVDGDTPEAWESALRAGRNYVVFEALGTPVDFGVWLDGSDGDVSEVGATAGPGVLHIDCPRLWSGSPQGKVAPEVTVTVLKDGASWATGCGAYTVEAPGVYRVVVRMVPHHLEPFLGSDPSRWMTSYPWIYSNAIRVE